MEAYVTGSDYHVLLEIGMGGELDDLCSSELECVLMRSGEIPTDKRVTLRLDRNAERHIALSFVPQNSDFDGIQRVELVMNARAWQRLQDVGSTQDRQGGTDIVVQDSNYV